jgi:hypothetical protein
LSTPRHKLRSNLCERTIHNMIRGSSYPQGAEPNSERGGVAPPASSDAAMLEVEIADLITNRFSLSDQSDDRAGGRAAWDETRASQQWVEATHEDDDIALDPNGACHERPVRNADIKVYDREKLAGLASSSAQIRPPVIIVGVLSLAALSIAGFGAWNSNYFVKPVPSSVPIEQKATFLTHPPSAVEPPRQAMPSVSTNSKIDDSIAKELGNRRDPKQNAGPIAGDTKKAALAPPNTAPALESAAVHRRPKSLPMPFPETKPTTIDGWVVREVANGTAVLQGPNGVWKATRGDTVPGLGKVDSIVRWGSRWIVATSRGLIATQ